MTKNTLTRIARDIDRKYIAKYIKADLEEAKEKGWTEVGYNFALTNTHCTVAIRICKRLEKDGLIKRAEYEKDYAVFYL